MTVTRRTVLTELAAASGVEPSEATVIGALAGALHAEPAAIETHLNGLVAYEFARREPDGAVRVTVTGEQLLELDLPLEAIIVDAPPE